MFSLLSKHTKKYISNQNKQHLGKKNNSRGVYFVAQDFLWLDLQPLITTQRLKLALQKISAFWF